MSKPKLLVIGDFACTTGFGTANEALLRRIKAFDAYQIYVIGVNATGDPHPLQRDFMIYPANLHDGDIFGVQRTPHIAAAIKPDLVVIHQDSWNIPHYLDGLDLLPKADQPPVIAWCPADAHNQWSAAGLNGRVALLLAPTEFGKEALIDGGWRGRAEVLPYGVETDLFTPGDRTEARQALHFPEAWLNDFVIGRADRNAARKRYDLTIEYFTQWWKDEGQPDNVRLLVHCRESDTPGWNLGQLASYYGLEKGRLAFTDPNMDPRYLWERQHLPKVYRAWNVHWSLTHGEGFGLVAMESAACGIPQILPDSAAYGDLFAGAAALMAPSARAVMPGGANSVGQVVGYDEASKALHRLYTAPQAYHDDLVAKALTVARNPKFQWDAIAQQFHTFCQEVLDGR